MLGIPATNVTLLDFEDGLLNNAPERAVRERVVATLRTVRPEAVFVWSPYLDFSRYYYGFEHPDHRTTGMRRTQRRAPPRTPRRTLACFQHCAVLSFTPTLLECRADRAGRCVPVGSRLARFSRPGDGGGDAVPGEGRVPLRLLRHGQRDWRWFRHNDVSAWAFLLAVTVLTLVSPRRRRYVDVSADEVMSAKIAALSAHRSQYSNATAVADGVRTFAALVASEVNDSGGPVLTYAEAFAHVPMLPGS